MKIAVLTYGTRGDVQPYAVIAHALSKRGHDVRIGVCENLVGMTEAIGLDTVSIPFDTQEFMSSEQGRAVLSAGRTTKFMTEALRRETEARDAIGAAFIDTCRDADIVISNVLSIIRARSIAEAIGARLMAVYTVPVEPTSEFASPYLFRSTRAPTAALRRFSHLAFETVYWQGSRRNETAFRRQLGLRPNRTNPFRDLRRERVQVQHLISRELMAEAADWPAHVRNVGAVEVPKELRAAWGESVDEDLATWLDAGDPPVFFGFGSMPVLDPAAALAMIREVAQRLGVRALVGAGWSDLASDPTGADVFVTKSFDHAEALPRCSAAVHHGGAGTTQTVMRAGIPAVITHVFADQPMWAMRVERHGLGTATPYQSVTADRLTEALRPLLATAVKERCADVAARMAREDAVGAVLARLGEGRAQ
jgi:UDP:flavonoid glycosyltransferase YjiC (YdhE family)